MESNPKSYRQIILQGVSMLLWALTALLAGYEVFLTRHIVSRLYLKILDRLSLPINVLERLGATGLGNIASLIMAILAIMIVVGGFDYHWSHGGEKRSFKLLGWTFGFQIIILALYIWL